MNLKSRKEFLNESKFDYLDMNIIKEEIKKHLIKIFKDSESDEDRQTQFWYNIVEPGWEPKTLKINDNLSEEEMEKRQEIFDNFLSEIIIEMGYDPKIILT